MTSLTRPRKSRKPADAYIHTSKIQVPYPVVFGHYEYLSEEELHELIVDLNHELARRAVAGE